MEWNERKEVIYLGPSLLKKWGKEMAYNFIGCDMGQKYLLPPSLLEWLPKGDLAWFILDEVDERRLEPSMMVSLLLYGYCMGRGRVGE